MFKEWLEVHKDDCFRYWVHKIMFTLYEIEQKFEDESWLEDDEASFGYIVNYVVLPDNYILEMICDWWAFSWKSGNLDEIFKWYEEHGPYMKLSIRTRQKVEDAFSLIKQKLEDMKDILNLQISQMCQKNILK